MKIASFNVNSIRTRLPIITQWIKQNQPDVLCLQETKCQDKDFPGEAFREAGYVANIKGQKAYNGVAVLTKSQPAEVIREFSDGQPDEEARLIAARIDGVWVVNTYIPQGRDPADPAFAYKLDFFARLKHWFAERFKPEQPLVLPTC